MGQQQLLLIILGILIIGIAVVVGINYFTSSSGKANREAVIADLTDIATLAQQYYRRSVKSGGGGNSFIGWTVPENFSKTSNMSAEVNATVAAHSVILTGLGTEKGNDGTSAVKVTILVRPKEIASVTVIN